MSVAILDCSAITTALQTLLNDSPDIGQSGVTVERGAEPPADPPSNGWIGIYRTRMQFPERVIGAGMAGRSHRVSLLLWIRANGASSDDTETSVDKLVTDTLNAVLNNSSIGGTVDTLDDGIEVRYTDYSKSADTGFFIQDAFILITGLKSI